MRISLTSGTVHLYIVHGTHTYAKTLFTSQLCLHKYLVLALVRPCQCMGSAPFPHKYNEATTESKGISKDSDNGHE
jgi:hypothetical protein